MVRCVFAVCAIVLATSALAGCSNEAPKGVVKGEVTLDGQPLKTGLITFAPLDGKSQTADATIADGKFSAEVPLGEMRVEIKSPRVIGKRKMYDTPDSPTVDDVAEAIPAQYNVNSKLKVTVVKGTVEPKFPLTSR
jgi:hypothetical protein